MSSRPSGASAIHRISGSTTSHCMCNLKLQMVHPGTISFSVNGYEAEKHGEAVRINIRRKALAAQYLPSEQTKRGESV